MNLISLAFLCLLAVADTDANCGLKVEITVSPEKIYVGDFVQFDVSIENTTSEPIEEIPEYLLSDYFQSYFYATSKHSNEQAVFHYCRSLHMDGIEDGPLTTLAAGEKRRILSAVYEVPALEGLQKPFWKNALQWNENHEAKINVHAMLFLTDEKPVRKIEGKTEITIKRRTDQEMQMLEQWCKALPEGVFQENDANHQKKCDHSRMFREPLRQNINYWEYEYWHVLPEGCCKPPPTLWPKKSSGFREIEEYLTDGTLKNEIRKCRVLFELGETNDPTKVKEILDETISWLEPMEPFWKDRLLESISSFILRQKQMSRFWMDNYNRREILDTIETRKGIYCIKKLLPIMNDRQRTGKQKQFNDAFGKRIDEFDDFLQSVAL